MLTTHSRRQGRSMSRRSAELALAVPQVVAHRVTRMALAGPSLSERDRKEFTRMWTEKGTAFAQAWQAMALQSVVAQQALTASFLPSLWTPWWLAKASPLQAALQVQGAALGVLGKGLEPVHRKAVANARRLARTRLR